MAYVLLCLLDNFRIASFGWKGNKLGVFGVIAMMETYGENLLTTTTTKPYIGITLQSFILTLKFQELLTTLRLPTFHQNVIFLMFLLNVSAFDLIVPCGTSSSFLMHFMSKIY